MIYDIGIAITYLALIFIAGLYFSRRIKSTTDYFLAARGMPWYWIMASVWATNIGFVHGYLAHGAAAYEWGVVQANFEWFQGPVAFILAGVFFITFYWRAGIFTLSQFLERRYNAGMRVIYSVIWTVMFIVTVSSGIYLAGMFLYNAIGIPFWWSVFIITGIAGTYTLLGGLGAVIMMDVVQFFIMMISTLPLYFIAMHRVGGWEGIKQILIRQWEVSPQYLSVMPDAHHPYGPGPWIILGLCFVLAMGWNVAHQAMIQRNLGARSIYDAKLGNIMACIPKTIGAWLYHLPMIAAPIIFATSGIFVAKADAAYGVMILNILPHGLIGIFIAGLLAAGLSSVDSMMNSTSTMFVKDIYERFLVKGKSDAHYFKVGRITTLVVILIALGLVPLIKEVELIMWLQQTLLSFFQGPFLAVLLMGIFWRRSNGKGALLGLLVGAGFNMGLKYLYPATTFFIIAWWGFLVSLFVTWLVSILTSPPELSKLKGLTWGGELREEIEKAVRERIEKSEKIEGAKAIYRPIWVNMRFWVTVILLFQIVLLLFFA